MRWLTWGVTSVRAYHGVLRRHGCGAAVVEVFIFRGM